MDESMRRMVAEAYDETLDEALSQGQSADRAHREALTAAAMFYASLSGIDDAAARSAVESIGLQPHD